VFCGALRSIITSDLMGTQIHSSEEQDRKSQVYPGWPVSPVISASSQRGFSIRIKHWFPATLIHFRFSVRYQPQNWLES
jgi:hypothetical protein